MVSNFSANCPTVMVEVSLLLPVNGMNSSSSMRVSTRHSQYRSQWKPRRTYKHAAQRTKQLSFFIIQSISLSISCTSNKRYTTQMNGEGCNSIVFLLLCSRSHEVTSEKKSTNCGNAKHSRALLYSSVF